MASSVENFRTLLADSKTNTSEKWYPHSIEDYRNNLTIKSLPNGASAYDVKSNLAYNFQYLEYLILQLNALPRLSQVLKTMLYKSFIITGMSIVEASFYAILVEKNALKPDQWREIASFKSNPKKAEFEEPHAKPNIMTETSIKIEDPSIMVIPAPTLDRLIKKIEKYNIGGLTTGDYPVLKNLRKLRNHVHLQGGSDVDTDYKSFSVDDYLLMRRILFHLFGTDRSTLTHNPEIFLYLSTDDSKVD
ncbi:hypothetical protein [Lacticaseibacillus paracasei]|uniref:hypothetical protein n=1 Tax=Lacticaseibacillus paracasei TaxID=1597 RepID=UPI0003A2766A|nr:hypothetical protein [Lacticaseibacillus paracasei]MCT3362026.1 hypothetical protein [Lacticaseibacillus paracasei]UNG77864.1 hypothetical protein LJ555_11940 [Lacticaseibacillus paracasei]